MITSLSNSKIKYARKLKDRRFRQDTNQFFVEGIRIFGEAVQNNADIQSIIYSPELLTSQFCLDLIDSYDDKDGIIQVSKEVFRSLSKKDNPQGIGAIIEQRWQSLEAIGSDDPQGTWLALDSVQDPGNLGTILRTGDAVGVKAIILLDHSTDPYDITSIRASMGSIFSHNLVRCDIDQFKAWLGSNNIPVIGTSDSAKSDYYGYPYPERLVILMGSEKQGLQKVHIDLCHDLVSIPMIGRSDSLNLSIATSIVLYEVFNQRRSKINTTI